MARQLIHRLVNGPQVSLWSQYILTVTFKLIGFTKVLTEAGGLYHNNWILWAVVTWTLNMVKNHLRTIWNAVQTHLLSHFYFDSVLNYYDDSFDWVDHYIQSQPRYFRSTNVYELTSATRESMPNPAFDIVANNAEVAAAREQVRPKLFPISSQDFWVVFKGTVLRLRRTELVSQSWGGWNYGRSIGRSCINIRAFTRNKAILLLFLAEAKKLYEKSHSHKVALYTFNSAEPGLWDSSATLRQKRGWEGVILDVEVREKLRSSVRDFLASEQWYTNKAINYTMGILLYGPPGTGKTSSILALASEFGLPIYTLPLSNPNIDDELLMKAVRNITSSTSILLLEDVGAAYKNLQAQPGVAIPTVPPPATAESPVSPPSLAKAPSTGISLAALLNLLDGVQPQDGVIMIMTTNHLDRIDDALRRPGRIDLELHLKKATRLQALNLFIAFYGDNDSAHSNPAAGQVLPEDMAILASQWAAHVNDEEWSHAELQGLLFSYKRDPHGVVKELPKWIDRQRAKTVNAVTTLKVSAEDLETASEYDTAIDLDKPHIACAQTSMEP